MQNLFGIALAYSYFCRIMNRIFKKISNFVNTALAHRREPLRLEFILSDYCNLNCKGCTHYSPLAAKVFEPLDQLERNAAMLGKAVGKDIEYVYLIGGETLLYPELPEAMAIMRRHFPNTRIMLFTNGLLIPRMSDEFWQSARDNAVTLAITRYPVKFDYDAAEAECNRRGVDYKVFGDRGEEGAFLRFALDPAKSQPARLSHFKCFNRGCISVVGDKVYPCSISACIGHLNKAHATRFEHLPGDWFNVADIRGIRQIKRLRDRPVPFCGYCKPNPTVTDYGPSKRDKAEWVDD